MNSIEETLKSDSVVASVVLMLKTPATENKLLVIVEGEDDKKLFTNFFNDSETILYSLGGCHHFEDVLTQCNPIYEKRFIILKDADFDILNSKKPNHNNLFLTDTHDLETMILKSKKLERVCNEYSCPLFDLEEVLKHLLDISYMKWFDNVNNLKLNFKVISVCSYYNGKDPIPIDCYQQDLLGNGANKKILFSNSAYKYFIDQHHDVDLYAISNGHDVCDCIRHKIKLSQKGKNIASSDIQRCLRLLYVFSDFKKTVMYANIESWVNSLGMGDKIWNAS